jgi:hypothetical protein
MELIDPSLQYGDYFACFSESILIIKHDYPLFTRAIQFLHRENHTGTWIPWDYTIHMSSVLSEMI